MNIKKAVSMVTFIFALTYANFASAVEWTPLVRIPGLPASGTVNLSMYMLGLYNFILSIVGIVAVMMLIIGGMRYITAAGNSAAISDAKDIIQNAVVGLILALFSWIFIATINPDALYIKQPGSSFTPSTVHLAACYQLFDDPAGSGKCICNDGTDLSTQSNAGDCHTECKKGHCKLPDPYPCIVQGSPPLFTSLNFDEAPYNGRCKCIDDVFVEPKYSAGPLDCNAVCSNPAYASDNNYHGVNWDLRAGHSVEGVVGIGEGENFTVTVDKPVYFDFSRMRDCNGGLVHIATNWDAIDGVTPVSVSEWCCMNTNPNCSSTWGNCCNPSDIACWWAGNVPDCYTDSHLFNSSDYPIYRHTFTTVTPPPPKLFPSTTPPPQSVWVGVSVKMDMSCDPGPPPDIPNSCICHDNNLEKWFQIIVNPQ
ncbi:MAG: pilin [Patescibacteria group bacterium]|nr:pilin [Patescibacteria group bacterium]